VSAETQVDRARLFRSLHQGDRVLVLPNAWDVISARVFEDGGFAAVGTTSFGIARAHGLKDGQNAARECSLETVRRITAALAVPLTADIEAGYGESAEEVSRRGGRSSRPGPSASTSRTANRTWPNRSSIPHASASASPP